MHIDAPALEYFPILQRVHDFPPALYEKVPAAHLEHSEAPILLV